MPEIKRIHHIAVVVENIDVSLEFWQTMLGIVPSHISDYPEEDARIAFLPLGESKIELVQPTASDSGLRRFLEKRGPGMHHLCLVVDDLRGLLQELASKNVQLINDEPKVGEDGRLYAFIHPKSTGGVLVELYQLLNNAENQEGLTKDSISPERGGQTFGMLSRPFRPIVI